MNELIKSTKDLVKLTLFNEDVPAWFRRVEVRKTLRKFCGACVNHYVCNGYRCPCDLHTCRMQEWANNLLKKQDIAPLSLEEIQGITDEVTTVHEAPAPAPVVVDMTPSTKHPGRPRVNHDLHVVHNGVEQVFSVRPDVAEAQIKLLCKVLGLRKHGDVYRNPDSTEKVWLSC